MLRSSILYKIRIPMGGHHGAPLREVLPVHFMLLGLGTFSIQSVLLTFDMKSTLMHIYIFSYNFKSAICDR